MPLFRSLLTRTGPAVLSAAAVLSAVAAGACLAAAPASATTAAGQTETLAPTADSYVNTATPTTTYGSAIDLRTGEAYGGTKIAFLHFDVPAADAARVTSARLVITRTNHHLPATTVTASTVNGTWDEATLDAANAPAVGTALDTESTNSSTSSVSFDVTKAVTAGGAVDVALTSPVATDTAIFRSREFGSGTPQLVVTLAPCTVSSTLVSSCQVWLGDAPQAHYTAGSTQTQRLAYDENYSGRQFDILHQYQTNGTLFPNAETIGLAENGGRMLYENWKPSTTLTWAQVAAGGADARIDAEAAYLRSHFDEPFLLTIWHEPENDVNATAGSGMTAADYVAMYRHVVLRLRADGVTKAVTVMNYMGYFKWDSLRNALYPGDDVVDWIAWDPYMHSPSDAPGHDFAALVDTAHNGSPGFYDWATTTHPGKPLMLGEFGAFDDNMAANPDGQGQFYASVGSELAQFPAIRAIDYFTMNPTDVGEGKATQPTENSDVLTAWQQMTAMPALNGPAIAYSAGAVVAR